MNIISNDILEITTRYDMYLENTVKDTILKTYLDSIEELRIKGLIGESTEYFPRLDHFIKTTLLFSFNKLHKRDKLKALDLLEEMKQDIMLNLNDV